MKILLAMILCTIVSAKIVDLFYNNLMLIGVQDENGKILGTGKTYRATHACILTITKTKFIRLVNFNVVEGGLKGLTPQQKEEDQLIIKVTAVSQRFWIDNLSLEVIPPSEIQLRYALLTVSFDFENLTAKLSVDFWIKDNMDMEVDITAHFPENFRKVLKIPSRVNFELTNFDENELKRANYKTPDERTHEKNTKETLLIDILDAWDSRLFSNVRKASVNNFPAKAFKIKIESLGLDILMRKSGMRSFIIPFPRDLKMDVTVIKDSFEVNISKKDVPVNEL